MEKACQEGFNGEPDLSPLEYRLMLEYCFKKLTKSCITEDNEIFKTWMNTALKLLSSIKNCEPEPMKGANDSLFEAFARPLCPEYIIIIKMCVLLFDFGVKHKRKKGEDLLKLNREFYRNISHCSSLLKNEFNVSSYWLESLVVDRNKYMSNGANPRSIINDVPSNVRSFIAEFVSPLSMPYLEEKCWTFDDEKETFLEWIKTHTQNYMPREPPAVVSRRFEIKTNPHREIEMTPTPSRDEPGPEHECFGSNANDGDGAAVAVAVDVTTLVSKRRKSSNVLEKKTDKRKKGQSEDSGGTPSAATKSVDKSLFSQLDKELYKNINPRPKSFCEKATSTSVATDVSCDSSKVRGRKLWTKEEEGNLREGVRRFGPGKWKEIKDHYLFEGRSNVDLKDKWRNIKN